MPAVRAPGRSRAVLADLRDRFSAWQNGMIAKASFRDWAGRFPLTAKTSRREAAALFDLAAGFVYSQILTAACELDLFDHLAEGPLRLNDIAVRIDLSHESTLCLLRAAAALQLVDERTDGRFALGRRGAALVDNAGVIAMIRHHRLLYRDLADPVALLRDPDRSTDLSRFWSYPGRGEAGGENGAAAANYSDLMGVSQSFIARDILDAHDVRGYRRILDIGGGDGTFLRAVAARAPEARLVLFDLPDVARIAQDRFAAAGLAARSEVVGGSFLDDPLPAGADLITLNRVLHDHDDGDAAKLLAAIRSACSSRSTLLVAEPMAGTPGAVAAGNAYFGFYFLAMRQGRPRSAETIAAMLKDAGFSQVDEVATPMPLLVRVLLARV
jgi:demethylspheroidene O-methyltransferase